MEDGVGGSAYLVGVDRQTDTQRQTDRGREEDGMGATHSRTEEGKKIGWRLE